MIFLTLITALFISSVAAWFSIAGLIAIFPGAAFAVGLMGAALEMGKLVSASWIYRYWNNTNLIMKGYFVSSIIILSFITSIGIFGYLTRAHVEGTQGLGANTDQIFLLDEQINNERQTIAMSRLALQQMDAAVNNLSANEKTTERAVAVRNNQRNERTNISKTILLSNTQIVELQKQKSSLNVGQRKLETEIGPIKYFAQLVYAADDAATIDKAVRMLTLMIIFVFDPLAILLIIAANISAKNAPKNTVTSTSTTNSTENIQSRNKSKIRLDFGDEKSTPMKEDWNPGSWFKMVKRPK